MQTALDVMTTPVIHVAPSTTIESAARLMLEHRVSGLPVTDESGAPVGMLTEGDLLRRVEIDTLPGHSRWRKLFGSVTDAAREYVRTHSRRVSEIMSTNVLSVAPDTPLDEVVTLMEKHNIKRVPVVEMNRMIGIVSRANLVAAMVSKLTLGHLSDEILAQTAGIPSDSEIKENILREIRAEYWAPIGTIDMAVKDGVVELTGMIFDANERLALRVAVENVPGVKSVVDHLTWVEPISGTVIAP